MSIGAFAQATRLSARALRLYDASGLLVPARVDPNTGYRSYEPAQLERARWIARLRELAVPLEDLTAMLALEPAAMAARLRDHAAALRRNADSHSDLAEHLATRLEGRRSPTMDVHTRDVPARRLLTCAKLVTAAEVEDFAGAQFTRYAGENPVPRPEGVTGAPFLRYHGELGPDTDALVQFCCPVTEDAYLDAFHHDITGMVTVTNEQAHRSAYVDVPARHAYTSLPFEAINDWLTDHGASAAGFPEQIILARSHEAADDDIVYQITIPLS